VRRTAQSSETCAAASFKVWRRSAARWACEAAREYRARVVLKRLKPIGDVRGILLARSRLRTEYNDEKKTLSVYLTQEITKLPGKLTLQFRDAAGKNVATLPLDIKALPKPETKSAAPDGNRRNKKEKK